ncbi:FdtA/QdtA family cupin domain-containing protein, partial [Campylobacter lanienae]
MNYKILNFNPIGDGRGQLVSLESLKNIPFDIKRVYYIYDTNTEPRGFHAHTKLEQVVVALAGSC